MLWHLCQFLNISRTVLGNYPKIIKFNSEVFFKPILNFIHWNSLLNFSFTWSLFNLVVILVIGQIIILFNLKLLRIIILINSCQPQIITINLCPVHQSIFRMPLQLIRLHNQLNHQLCLIFLDVLDSIVFIPSLKN